MKLIVLLVTAFLATSLAQLSTGDLALSFCRAITTEKECLATQTADPGTSTSQVKCQWCPSLLTCRPLSLTCECLACPLSLKPSVVCADGSTQITKCDLTTCAWVSSDCPTPAPCTCPDANLANARLCPDGTTVAPVCNINMGCTWTYPTCPTCNGCVGLAVPEYVAQVCPDGTSTKPICDDVNCKWVVPTCSTTGGSVCPPGVGVVKCYISPCSSVQNSTNYNKEKVITCKEDYCGGCNARCYDSAGVEVKCLLDVTTPPIDCTVETNCPAEKPPICANGKLYCTRSTTQRDACQWGVYCPPTDPNTDVCTTESCGVNTKMSLVMCSNGAVPKWTCQKVALSDPTSTSVSACSWTSECPSTVDPTVKCLVGGPCGDQCIEATSSLAASLAPIDATLCRSALTCEQKCSISYRILGSCNYNTGFGCQYSYQDGYYECLKQCSGVVVDPPQCSGRVCDCDYANCYTCMLDLTLDSGRTISKGVCASTTYGDACAAFGGKAIFSKPERCDVVNLVSDSNVPAEVVDVVKALKEKVDHTKIQDKINEIIGKIPEIKDFLIAAQLTTDPEVTTDNQVTQDIVLSISGPRDPTTIDLDAICEKLVKPALSSVAGTKASFLCKLEKVKSGSVKRGVSATSSNTYSANVVTTSGAAVVVMSFFVAVVALLALVVF